MLRWIRGKRLDMRTTVIVIVLALIAWGIVVATNVRDFIPEELRAPRDSSATTR